MKQPIETIFAAIEISVVSKAGESAESLESRLAWIDFPWVDIEMDRTARLIDLFEGPSSKPPREDAEISTTTNGYLQWAIGKYGYRVFRDRVAIGLGGVGIDRRVGDSVPIVAYWNDAAIVKDAMFLKNLDSPTASARDRKTGGTKMEYL